MSISSLPGPFGVGVLGKEALDFIDFIADMGFTYWQVLPLNPVDKFYSPYKSSSAFAGSFLYIDPRSLKSIGLLSQEEVDDCICPFNKDIVHYTFVAEKMTALLHMAYSRINDTMRSSIDEFSSRNKWVEPYALFCAIKDHSDGEKWRKWDLGYSDYEFCKKHYSKFIPLINFYKFVQYIFFSQWSVVKNYANSKGIKIIGDMPFYVSMDSADVWSNTYNFMLDEQTYAPLGLSGVPSDYFSPDGQLWGNPLYNWEAMEDEGFSWWIERLKFMSQNFDIIRIDHFRAFASYWCVNSGASTATDGKWLEGPGEKFFDVLKTALPDLNLVAEDLGSIGNDVTELLNITGIPGMRVMQFGLENMNDSNHLPHNYCDKCISYIGTHDSDTFLGFIEGLSPDKRKPALDYCGIHSPQAGNADICRRAIEVLMRSNSYLSIITLQDMCALGAKSRMNIPGTMVGNWVFRATFENLSSIDKEYYKNINHIFSR